MGPKAWCVLGKPSGLKPGFTIASSIYPKLCLLQFTRDIAVVGFGVAKENIVTHRVIVFVPMPLSVLSN